ncbi:MAG: TIGR04282 family arsenosugar biosynthesis glycosyltransferase [Acidobacteriota bacterium]
MVRLPSLVLFARVPESGRVKTRLASRLTDAGALRLYRAFLEDASRLYGVASGWEPVLAAEPDPDAPELVRLFPPPWRRETQGEGGLGERLALAFSREFLRGAPAAIAVGSDHPALAREALFEALARVEGGGAAVIPAEDGGYCAIAFSADAPWREALRDVPWSTDAVLSVTRRRLAERGVELAMLPPGYDVDRPEDVDRLRRDLSSRDPGSADYPAATARALADLP